MTNAVNQNNVAIMVAAETNRFFFIKNEEKIIEAIAMIADDTGIDASEVGAVLETEKDKRSKAHALRVARTLARREAKDSLPISGGYDAIKHEIREGSDFVITVAQNNTDIDTSMLGALKAFCNEKGAQLIICKTLYNKNGFNNPDHDATDGIYFDPALSEYIQHEACYLGTPALFLAADANVIPTAKNPSAGFEGLTHAGISMVIPAVKVSLKCTASLKNSTGKDIFSTGAITKRNYVKRKAGQVANHEHNIAALYVHVNEDGTFSARHLEQMAGFSGFYDHHTLYTADGIVGAPHSVACLQFGDIHAEKMNADNRMAALATLGTYKPQNIMLHDVLDFSSRNHHNIKDSFFIAKNDASLNSVLNDLNRVTEFIIDALKNAPNALVHIIESNHDLALERWIKESDFKKDSINAGTYLPLALAMVEAAYNNESINLLEYALTCAPGMLSSSYGETNRSLSESAYCRDVIFHNTDESVLIVGVEHGIHGHTGINGAKGSPNGFRSLGVPMNTGHTHTPSIVGGVYTAGVTASLEMGYNVGPSSWRVAHIVTYVNGQRQIIFS